MRILPAGFLALFIVLAACSGGGGSEDTSPRSDASATPGAGATTSSPQPSATDEFIGTATMTSDGTITLHLRATDASGRVGEGTFEYPPDHPQYQTILDHVQPIEAGQTVNVRPFPE